MTKDPNSRIRQFLDLQNPVRWLFCGDSITHGVRHTRGQRDYTQHFAERIRMELGRRRDVVINTAISGDTTRGVLADFDWRVAQFHPEVVFLMIGMNDCARSRSMKIEEFISNLEQFCRRAQDAGASVVLQTSPPVLEGMAPDREEHFPVFMDAIRSVASSQAVALVDHEAFWRRHADKRILWMSDSYHPGPHGHMALAYFLFEALGILDEASETCRLPVP